MVTRGSIDFGDIDGKLIYLRVECDKCGRQGRYAVARLVQFYGRTGRLMDWKDKIAADCPRRLDPGHRLARP